MTTRIAVGSTVTLNHQFASTVPDGASVTVQATNALGDDVFAAAKDATLDGDVAKLELTAADLPDEPDRLAFTWSANDELIETDHLVLDGAVYTSTSRIKSRADELLGTLDDAKVQTVLDEVLDRIEGWIGIPFVPRYEVERFAPRYRRDFLLLQAPLRQLRRVTVAGVEVDPADWLTETSGRILRTDGGHFAADEAVEVHYVRGLDQPPADLVGAIEDTVEQLCLERYGRANAPARAQFAGDGMSWIVSNPDPSRGRLFGINRVDGVFKAHHDQWAGAAVG